MKKISVCLLALLMIASILSGCGTTAKAETTATVPTAAPETEATTAASTEEVTEAATEEDIVYEGDAATYYIDEAYHDQIARYSAALKEQWDEGMYYENELSPLPFYYYEGNPLDNVGFGFVDLDNDGYWELIIGAIANADKDPAVFEIWTRVDGEPVMLAQGSPRNRYVLQYVEEDEMWYVVNEASNSAFNSATHYLMLQDGKFEVVQGVVLDAMADEQNPWFLAYDLDWDVSNDEPIDEETANAILDVNRTYYTVVEYFPYSFF